MASHEPPLQRDGLLCAQADRFYYSGTSVDRVQIPRVGRRAVSREEAAKAVREEPVKALVRYLVWPKTGGSKKKRPLVREEYAILLPPFAYLASGTRKRLDGSHFEVVRRFESTPSGSGEVFAFIESRLPRK